MSRQAYVQEGYLMRILGIDPGIGTMGYGVVDAVGGQYKAVDYGVVKTSKEDSLPLRLSDVEKAMYTLFEKFNPDEMAVEELFFTKNITTGIAVAEARGVILLCGRKCLGDKIFEYTPNQIKQALTGTGSADKRQMQIMTQMILNLPKRPSPDDAADALAVALTHAQTGRLSEQFKVGGLNLGKK